MSDDDDDGAGYKRPPKKTRFKKGKSGNPKGRPKSAKNFATVIAAELNDRVAVSENGKRKSITKRHAITKQLVNKAAGGCLKAIPMVLNEARTIEGDGSAGGPAAPLGPDDKAVIDGIVKRLRLFDAADPSKKEDPKT